MKRTLKISLSVGFVILSLYLALMANIASNNYSEQKINQNDFQVNTLIISPKNKQSNLLQDFSGNYYFDSINNSVISLEDIQNLSDKNIHTIKSIWSSIDSNGQYDKIIVFIDNVYMAFWESQSNKITVYHYSLNTDYLVISNEIKSDVYIISESLILPTTDDNESIDFTDINTTTQPIENITNGITEELSVSGIIETNQTIDKNNENIEKEKFDNFKDLILTNDTFWELLVFLFSVILMLIAYFKLRELITKYRIHLKDVIFDKEHNWLGDNKLRDIFVPVKIHYNDNSIEEYDLVEYFSENLINNSTNSYAILGDAGEGKTLSVSKLVFSILENFQAEDTSIKGSIFGKYIPVNFTFNELAICTSVEDIIEKIYSRIGNIAKNTTKELNKYTKKIIKSYLKKGKFIVFFDGYDEVTEDQSQSRIKIAFLVDELIEKYPKSKFIITSRTYLYHKEKFRNIKRSHTLYLSALKKEQIYEFIEKWKFPDDKSSIELYHRIINTPQIERIVSNPLLLTMVAHTYSRNDFQISRSKISLYENCCNCLLSEWEEQKNTNRYSYIDNVEVKNRLLALLAYQCLKNSTLELEEIKILKVWKNDKTVSLYFIGEPIDILDNIINESGLLIRSKNSKNNSNIIKFKHTSFYEYYLALYYVKYNENDEKVILFNTEEKQNIAFFYYSMVDDEEIVDNFIRVNQNNPSLIKSILLERNISDKKLVSICLTCLLYNSNYSNIDEVLDLSYLALQYPEFYQSVFDFFYNRLNTTTDINIKANIIIGLLNFATFDQIEMILSSHINQLNITLLVQHANDKIDIVAKNILHLLLFEKKYIFIEELAKAYRFNSLYDIYINGKDIREQHLGLIGFLYLIDKKPFIKFLNNKKFYNETSWREKEKIENAISKFGWINKDYNNEELHVIYALLLKVIWLYPKVDDYLKIFDFSFANNKIIFLLSYMASDPIKTVQYFEYKNVKVKKRNEYEYHWNRIKSNVKLFDYFRNDNMLSDKTINTITFFLIIIMFVFQNFLYLIETVSNYHLSNSSMLSNVFRPFINSRFDIPYFIMFFIMIISCLVISKIISNHCSRKQSYFLLALMFLVLFFIYCIVIESVFFIITMFILFFIMLIFQIIKINNNYPTLKYPEYNYIVEFLSE